MTSSSNGRNVVVRVYTWSLHTYAPRGVGCKSQPAVKVREPSQVSVKADLVKLQGRRS